MTIAIESQSVSIVLLGKFNPAIFSPAWLAKNGLATDEQMDTASVGLIHQEVTQFVIGPYKFDVSQPRFSVRSSEDPFIKQLELVVAIFGDLLAHTPITKLGINYECQFKCRSARQRLELGRRLAPIEPWGDFGKRMESKSPVEAGGMLTMTMQQNKIAGPEAGYRRVEIAPMVDSSAMRVKMDLNDHYELPDDPEGVKPNSTDRVIAILLDQFEGSLAESKKIVGDLIEFTKGLPE